MRTKDGTAVPAGPKRRLTAGIGLQKGWKPGRGKTRRGFRAAESPIPKGDARSILSCRTLRQKEAFYAAA